MDGALIISQKIYIDYDLVDGRYVGDKTKTGDDRTLRSSYNDILRIFDHTDVDGDEVKNIYDAYPTDATKH